MHITDLELPPTHPRGVFAVLEMFLQICEGWSSCLTLKLFEPPLQLVVVEGGLSREPKARAGAPDGAETRARPPGLTLSVRWAGAAR